MSPSASSSSPSISQKPLRLVLISDTHNDHRALQGHLPPGDVLIHAGDFTCYGRVEHLQDFNEWLGSLDYAHKIVVNGNHENNAPWQPHVKSLLTNATFLKNEMCSIRRSDEDSEETSDKDILNIYGTDFYWPVEEGQLNPHHGMIPGDVDVIISHNPVKGFVDGGSGCPSMRQVCGRQCCESRLQLITSGHIHSAYGIAKGDQSFQGINASSVGGTEGSRKVCNPPIVIDI